MDIVSAIFELITFLLFEINRFFFLVIRLVKNQGTHPLSI